LDVFNQQMLQGKLYAQLPQRQRKVSFALDGIVIMQQLAPNSYASISFGKDSICLAHMLYRIAPGLPMYFLASWESFIIHNYDEVIESFIAKWPINLNIVMADNVSQNLDASWKKTRDIGQRDLQNMCNREDWDGWYWGLAKDESKGRRMTLSCKWGGQPHPTIFRYTDGKYRCCPLMNWNMKDIAAYVQEHGLPLLDIYRQYGLEMRTTARVTRNMAELGGVAYLKQLSTEKLNRLTARFPELRCYV